MKHLIVGISGASGAPLAVKLLQDLSARDDITVHLIITKGGEMTLLHECALSPLDLRADNIIFHDIDAIGDTISSGSFKTLGMIIVPCSMKTVAGIASGYSDNLLLRAADVCLKERRRLVLVARESPLSTLHLKNMLEVSRCGAVLLPPMLTFYSKPASIDELIDGTVNRVLSQFDLESSHYEWQGMPYEK